MNPLILLAEDTNYTPNTLYEYHSKAELSRRYASVLEAYNESLKEVEALQAKYEALKERYDKLYETAQVFGGERTVGMYAQK